VEAKNQGESLMHQTEKSLAEHGDKVGETEKTNIQTAIDGLKAVFGTEDIEGIKAKTAELVQASMKLGEAVYAASQSAGEAPHDEAHHDEPHKGDHKNDVIDADFREVGGDDTKKKRS